VSVPKISLHFPTSNVMELKKRYTNLYVPSDFFNAQHSWNAAYPIQDPFKVQYATTFHIFPKEGVEPPSPSLGPSRWQFDPTDSDYTWVAKVMLLSSPNIEELYERTCNFIDKDSKERDELVHPTRALKFLVGLKEKREIMAIGGPWSPSLDGPDPSSDPSTLIKTAIRTCGALTGIDLSGCTQWTKFLQIHYRRQATSSKPARTETVVIFFPDVWSVMPNKLEYDGLAEQYLAACKAKQEGRVAGVEQSTGEDEVGDMVVEEEETGIEEGGAGRQPVEAVLWSTLDPKTMKVGELRDQLEARGQVNKGLKSQLQARLQKCLKTEQESEENKTGGSSEGVDMVTEESEKTKDEDPTSKEEGSEEVTVVLDERQKEKIAAAYKTPSTPCIFVHPNIKAKSGKFDCRTESLSVLLDYRSEDNKEGTFEVSLFAELFNEMFIRDSAFKLYKAIQAAPDKPKDEKKEKKEEVVTPVEATKEAASASVEADNKGDEEKPSEEKREASVEMVEEKEKVMVTKNKDLLLGASYFDLSHCGYIETKDLEDILLPLELDLSRAEIKKLASKLAVKDQVNYRLLTDSEAGVDEPEESNTDLVELAKGFRKFIPCAVSPDTQKVGAEHIVSYKGSVIDVAKLQEKLEKSEKVRSATDVKLIELQKKFSQIKESSEKGEKTREKMTNDLRDIRKKVRGLEEEVATSSRESSRYLNILGEVYHKVMPIVRPPKTTDVKGTETTPQINGIEKDGEEAAAEVGPSSGPVGSAAK